MPHKLLPLLGLLALTPVLAQPAPAPTAAELLQRVINPDWPGSETRTDVLLGQLPQDLGLTLPAGSRVVGTVTTVAERGDFPSNTTVYFDTSLTPEQVMAHFARATSSGWQEAPGFPSGPYEAQGGFQPGSAISNRAFFRKTPAQLLNVTARAVPGTTQVTLRKQYGGSTERLLESIESRPPLPPSFLRLPKLAAPAGSTVLPEGGGSSNDSVTQYARITSTLERKALLEHYAAQLRTAGWRLVNQADVGQVTSTVWSFTQGSQERVGLLILAGTSPYRATLMTQAAR